jgi:hypothetical protein
MSTTSAPLARARQRSGLRRSSLVTRLALAGALIGALVLSGCAAGASTTKSATPTATPAPRVLYQSDFVHRASEWTLPPTWKLVNGALSNAGATTDTINLTVPYVVTVPQYTVTVVMRTLAANGKSDNDMYSILGQTPDGRTLFTAAMTEVERTLHSYTSVYPATPDPDFTGTDMGVSDYTPGTNPQPYVAQVDGVYLSFTASGGQIGGLLKGAERLSPARIVIQDQSMEMMIESVTITTP